MGGIWETTNGCEKKEKTVKFRCRICHKVFAVGNGTTSIRSQFDAILKATDITVNYNDLEANKTETKHEMGFYLFETPHTKRYKKLSLEQKKKQ